MDELKQDYQRAAGAAGEKLARRYTAATGKAAKAASDDAQRSYVEAMSDPKVLARRQNKLRKVTDQDMNLAMESRGRANYTNSVANSGDKWAQRAAPFISEAERIAATLPRRTRDPIANLTQRAGPIVKGLHDLKNKGA